MWPKLVNRLGMKRTNDSDLFTMRCSGRCGVIVYHSGKREIEIEWEMSGVPEHDILLAPIDLRQWNEPKGIEIPRDKQIEILRALRSWTKAEKLRTDIDLPLRVEFEDNPCGWAGCSEPRIKDSAYCSNHYDENLLRK